MERRRWRRIVAYHQPGERQGADRAAVGHAAQRVDAGAEFGAGEARRLVVGDIAGGVVALAGEGGEELPFGAFEDEPVGGEVIVVAEAVDFGEDGCLVLGRQVLDVKPKFTSSHEVLGQQRVEREAEGRGRVVGDIEVAAGMVDDVDFYIRVAWVHLGILLDGVAAVEPEFVSVAVGVPGRNEGACSGSQREAERGE